MRNLDLLEFCVRIRAMGANGSTESAATNADAESAPAPPAVTEGDKVGKVLQVILIDKSSSMNIGNYAKTVADNITIPTVRALHDKCDELTLAVSTFSGTLTHALPFHVVATFDKDAEMKLRSRLPKTANGSTRYYNSVSDMIDMVREHLKTHKYDRVALTVYSDGENTMLDGPDAETDMNERIVQARADGWVLAFVGIEHDVRKTTKSARHDECFAVGSRFEESEFDQCTRTCSARVVSAPAAVAAADFDAQVSDEQPVRINARGVRFEGDV